MQSAGRRASASSCLHPPLSGSHRSRTLRPQPTRSQCTLPLHPRRPDAERRSPESVRAAHGRIQSDRGSCPAELAEPPVGQVDLDFSAQPALRAERKHVANDQHPDHQHRVNRGPTRVRVIRRQLLVHPTQIEQTVDLPHQMIGRDHLVEIKRIEKPSLSFFPAAPSCAAPADPVSTNGIMVRDSHQREFCNTIPSEADLQASVRHVCFVQPITGNSVALPDALQAGTDP